MQNTQYLARELISVGLFEATLSPFLVQLGQNKAEINYSPSVATGLLWLASITKVEDSIYT